MTFHLEAPDPEFLYKLAVPLAYIVPHGTPVGRDRPTDGTGPYRIETYTPYRYAHLVRNPYFRVWSRAAQPEGLPDTIDLSTTLARGKGKPASARAAFLAAAAGRVDVPEAGVPQDLLETARTRYPAQLHVTPAPTTTFVVLNVHRSPFSSALARQALAFALDRAHMLENAGGTDLAETTCQLLPPGLPGYKPYCPFTVRPATGTWTAPDLQRARELVARSGTRGTHVHVLTTDQTPDFGKQDLDVAAALRKLGYQVSVKHFATDARYFGAIYQGGGNIDAAVSGWLQDYPAPSNFFSALFCANSPYSCKPALDRQIARVSAASAASGSSESWTALDRSVTDSAVVIPFINPKAIDFVSKRLQNYQHHPEFGLLIDQVWLR